MTTVAQELGCELLLETPPGHVLSDLVEENLSNVLAEVRHAATDLINFWCWAMASVLPTTTDFRESHVV
jgi:hypothetical protein